MSAFTPCGEPEPRLDHYCFESHADDLLALGAPRSASVIRELAVYWTGTLRPPATATERIDRDVLDTDIDELIVAEASWA